MDFALCRETIQTHEKLHSPSLSKKLIPIALIAGGSKKSSRERKGRKARYYRRRVFRDG